MSRKTQGGGITRTLSNLLLFFYLFTTFFFVSPITQATNYDVVVSVEIDQSTYTVLEVCNATNNVNFYEFDALGSPVMNGQGQAQFYPNDVAFDDKISYASLVLAVNLVEVDSPQSVTLLLYYGNISEWKKVLQIVYDEPDDATYKVVHNSLDAPFHQTDSIGTFSMINVQQQGFNGFKYSPDFQNNWWQQTPVLNLDQKFEAVPREDDKDKRYPISFKLEGTTSSGRTVRITGEGDDIKVEEWCEDDEEWKEIECEDEIEDIINEVAEDLENGEGDFEGEARDGNGDPVDLIIWRKNKDGTYTGIKMEMDGQGGWNLDGRVRVPRSVLCPFHYLPCQGDDPNPDGAWFVGHRRAGETYFKFIKYGWVECEKRGLIWTQYYFGCAPGGFIPTPVNSGTVSFLIHFLDAWPPSNP